MTDAEFETMAKTAHPMWLKCFSDEYVQLSNDDMKIIDEYVRECVNRQFESCCKKTTE